MIAKKSILITGGTGSFGSYFVNKIISYNNFNRIVIFSRDENKQDLLKNYFSSHKQRHKIRFFLGDVRDKRRLIRACEGINYVIHAAALKQVPSAEYDPFEYIKTNISGAQNIIEAALDTPGLEKVIALSTDKASEPVSLYGATKLCSDKLFVSANNVVGKRNLKFSVVRYGNVLGSRGSIIPKFLKLISQGKTLPITDVNMTRFNTTLAKATELILFTLKNMIGGEIFIQKNKSYKILDLIKALDSKSRYKIIGLRPGEKLHESMISAVESLNTCLYKNTYVIYSEYNDLLKKKYSKYKKYKNNTSFNSRDNSFYTVKELKKMIENYKKQKVF